MRTWSPIVSPQTFDPRQVEIHEKINLYLHEVSNALSNIGKGLTPDQSEKPLLGVTDDGRFFLLKGRPFGQKAHGAVEAGGSLTLSSTYHATKGLIYLGDANASAFDEANDRLGLGTTEPEAPLHVIGEGSPAVYYRPSAVVTSAGLAQGGIAPPASLAEVTPDGDTNMVESIAGNPSMQLRMHLGGDDSDTSSFPTPTANWIMRWQAKSVLGNAPAIQYDYTILDALSVTVTSGTVTEGNSYSPSHSISLTLAQATQIAAAGTFVQIKFNNFQNTTIFFVNQPWRLTWVEMAIATSNGGETAVLDQPSAGLSALVLRSTSTSALGVNFVSPTSGSAPWTIEPDGTTGRLFFKNWNKVGVNGANTVFSVGYTMADAGGLFVQALSLGIAAISYTGYLNATDGGDALSYPQTAVIGVDTDGATIPLTIYGKTSGQTASLAEFKRGSNSSDIRTIVDKDGNIGVRTKRVTLGASLVIYPASSSSVGVIIRGVASQSGDLLQVQDVTPTTKLHITSAGKLVTDNVAPQFNVPTGAVVSGQVWTATDTVGNGNWATPAEVENVGFYGDGSDGVVTIAAGTTTIFRDMYYDTLTVTGTLITNGWRVFVKNTLTNNGIISRDGVAGGNGVAAGSTAGKGLGGSAGTALTDDGSNSLGGSAQGAAGRSGTTLAGAPGISGSIETGEGGAGGVGGQAENSQFGALGGAATGSAGQIVAKFRSLGIVIAVNYLALVGGGSGGSSGAAGAGDGGSKGGGGGGAGSGGGVLAIWAKTLINNGTIRANGGAGGNGGNSDFAGGAGGGGGGGGGGFIYLFYDTLTAGTIQANGGAAGSVGSLGGFSTPSTPASAGSAGHIVKYSRLTGLFT